MDGVQVQVKFTVVKHNGETVGTVFRAYHDDVMEAKFYAIAPGEGVDRQEYGFPLSVVDRIEGTTVYLKNIDLSDYEVGS